MKTNIFALVLFFLCLSCFSCKKQDTKVQEIKILDTPVQTTHKWFSFNQNSFSEIENISKMTKVFLKPWTEATRITAGISYNNKAYFSVNRQGLLICDDDKISINQDENFFSKNSIGSFLIQDNYPIFHLYKQDTFNNEQKDETPVFVYFNPTSQIFYPFISKQDLSITKQSEVIATQITNNKLFFSVKDSSGVSTNFDYFYLDNSNFSSIKFISQVENNLNFDSDAIHSITESEFLSEIAPLPYSSAPERIQKLLKILPNNYDFSISLQFEDGFFQKYLQGKQDSDTIVEANAIITENYVAALFPDGTFYFSGSTKDRHLINDGNVVCMRLPKLPRGFLYSNFAITQNKLYASFEEYDFYQIGNAGFIQVNLDNTLYRAYP